MKNWPKSKPHVGLIELHALPPAETINGALIRELTGERLVPDNTPVMVNAYQVRVADRSFLAGFCVGDGEKFSPIGLAVIKRLQMEAIEAPLHVVPIKDADIAWDIVSRHLRSFDGKALLFACSDSDVYDTAIAPTWYKKNVDKYDYDGTKFDKLTVAQRRQILAEKAKITGRPEPILYPIDEAGIEEIPWIFRIMTPSRKEIRTAVWDGRRDYQHQLPDDIAEWVGGDRIAIVQLDSPVGINRRYSMTLTNHLATEFDGVVHWARDSETFESIIKSFVRLDLETVSAPVPPADWNPEIVFLAANS